MDIAHHWLFQVSDMIQTFASLVDGKKINVTEASVRRDLQLDDEEGTEAKFLIQEEIGEGLVMPTDPHHTPIITQPSSSQPQRKQKSRRSKRKDIEVPQPSDPTNVVDEAVNEEPKNTKTAQAQEITSLKLRVKKLKKKGGSRTRKLRRLYKVGRSVRVVSSDEASLGDQEDASKRGRKIHDIDADEDITLENVYAAEMFDVNDLHGDEVFVEKDVPIKEVSDVGKVNTASIATTVSAAIITKDEITLAQALTELKSVKPKVTTATTTTTKGILLQEPSESITTTTTIPSKDKGKGIMVEETLQMKKKDQISFDEQEIIRLQAKFDKEVRLAREKDVANIALTEEWNDIQAKIETDYELAQRLQEEEQEELTVDEKATLAGDELEQENAKKQKVDDDQEAAKMKELMKIVPDEEEVAVEAIHLATKPPSIVDWKIVKEGKISYYQIIRADGSSKRPEKGYERVLWGDLKTMFEHHVEDAGRIVGIKRLLDDLRVTAAKLMLLVYKLLLLVFRVNAADIALPLRDQRHQYLRFEGLEYTDTDIKDLRRDWVGFTVEGYIGFRDRVYLLAECQNLDIVETRRGEGLNSLQTLRGSGGDPFWEEGDDFGVDVLRFHTCFTDILGFLEKLEWWFEQDIDDEEEENKEGEGGSEV
ncbi:hypothetical protein Tco_0533829 [Tanacetum coccineum]